MSQQNSNTSQQQSESIENKPDVHQTPPHDDHDKVNLMSVSFISFTVTQALVALNDNMYRWLIIPIGKALLTSWLITRSTQPDTLVGGWVAGKTPEELTVLGANIALFLGALCFFLPFMVLVTPAGWVADRFSKRSVLIVCKVTEIVVMALGIVSILIGNAWIMFIVMFMMGAQSAFFSPAKYGYIPEKVRHDRISAANGIVIMTTMIAIIVGTVLGGYLFAMTTPKEGSALAAMFDPGQYRWWISAASLVGVASLGWVISLLLGRVPAASPKRPVPWNLASQTVTDMKVLLGARPLLLAAIGSAIYWSLGALAQSNIDQYGTRFLMVPQELIGPLLAILTVGIGIGAAICGFISRGRIELGLTSFGCCGIIITLIALGLVPAPTLAAGAEFASATSPSYLWACFWLFMLGLMAGCYDIPLVTFLQDRSPVESRGRILAGYNFLSFAGMTLAAGVYFVLSQFFNPSQIWIVVAIGMIPVFFGIVHFTFYWIAEIITRFLLWVTYRPRVIGVENVPQEGGVLLVGNHVSWVDGFLLFLSCSRPVRYFAWAANLKIPIAGRLSRETRVIPVEPGARQSVLAMREASRGLVAGDVIGIFPEGGLTRTGQIGAFQAGYQSILRGVEKELRAARRNGNPAENGGSGNGGGGNGGGEHAEEFTGSATNGSNAAVGDDGRSGDKLPVPIVPVFIGGIWGSIYSYGGGRLFLRWPRRLRDRVTVVFGEPIYEMKTPYELRQIIVELGVEAMRKGSADNPEAGS